MGARRHPHLFRLARRPPHGLARPLARNPHAPRTPAEELGLTFEEYTLEILERGRYLQAGDRDAIEKIKRRRKGA
jgi:hypothetical protein